MMSVPLHCTYLSLIVHPVVVEDVIYPKGLCKECSKGQLEGHHSQPKDKIAVDSGTCGGQESFVQTEQDHQEVGYCSSNAEDDIHNGLCDGNNAVKGKEK